MSEYIAHEWFDAGSTGIHPQGIGVVLVLNEHDGFKAYIGIGFGIDEQGDISLIAQRGQKISHEIAASMFGWTMKSEWIKRHLAEEYNGYKYDRRAYDEKVPS